MVDTPEVFETTITAYDEEHARNLFEVINLPELTILSVSEYYIEPGIVFLHLPWGRLKAIYKE